MSARRTTSATLAALTIVLGFAAVAFVGLRAGSAEANTQQQAQAIAARLRCPVCNDLSAADSPAPLARQMRRQIEDQLAAGVPPAVIRQRFVDAYGPSVLLTPPDRGWGRVARLMPLVVAGGAGIAGAMVLRRSLRREATS